MQQAQLGVSIGTRAEAAADGHQENERGTGKVKGRELMPEQE